MREIFRTGPRGKKTATLKGIVSSGTPGEGMMMVVVVPPKHAKKQQHVRIQSIKVTSSLCLGLYIVITIFLITTLRMD